LRAAREKWFNDESDPMLNEERAVTEGSFTCHMYMHM
jgi:hypothetical protein